MKESSAKRGSPIPPNIILVLKQIMTVDIDDENLSNFNLKNL